MRNATYHPRSARATLPRTQRCSKCALPGPFVRPVVQNGQWVAAAFCGKHFDEANGDA